LDFKPLLSKFYDHVFGVRLFPLIDIIAIRDNQAQAIFSDVSSPQN